MLRWMIWYCSPDTGVKFEPYRSKLSSLLLGHGSTPQYYIFTSEQERNMSFVSNLNAKARLEPAISDFLSRQLYHCTRAPALASLSNTAIFSPCLCTLFYKGKNMCGINVVSLLRCLLQNWSTLRRIDYTSKLGSVPFLFAWQAIYLFRLHLV